MTSSRAQALIDDYETNTWLIHRHVDGVSDEDSLLQLPFQANCLNWILGHIVWRRNSVLAALGLPPLWEEDVTSMYRTSSDPITPQSSVRRFTDLLADLDKTQEAIIATLKDVTDAGLDKVVTNDRSAKRVIEHLQGFHWHETYHIGQLEILKAYIDSKS